MEKNQKVYGDKKYDEEAFKLFEELKMNKDGTIKDKNKKDLMTLSPGAFNKAMDDIFSKEDMNDIFNID